MNPIIHIPHSSLKIPSHEHYVVSEMELYNEMMLLTDHATDRIFKIDNGLHLITDFNRIFCDVERLPDNQEEMYKYGRGFYYTKRDSGLELRIESNENKSNIYNNYYLPHHNELNRLVNESLENNGSAFILDCHSFANTPFQSDLIKDSDRPDICIGTDSYHTPDKLVNIINDFFINKGYDVLIDNPYSGTIIPMEHYKKNPNVNGIMIELNRDLYMVGNDVIDESVNKLNIELNELFNSFDVSDI